MLRDTIEKDRPYFCQLVSAHLVYSGIFIKSDDKISVTFYSFGEKSISIDPEQPLIILLEGNTIASLHYTMFGGSSISHRDEKKAFESRTILANVLVAGNSKWELDDPVFSVCFSIKRSSRIFGRPVLDSSARPWDQPKVMSIPKFRFHEVIASLEIKRPNFFPDLPVSFSDSASYYISFEEPRRLDNYEEVSICITRFMSLLVGFRLSSSRPRLSKLSEAQIVEQCENNTYEGDHAVYYSSAEAIYEEDQSTIPFHFREGNPQFSVLEKSLRIWLERDKAWTQATAMMMECLKLRNVISRERLLAACCWLEEIPETAPQSSISDDKLRLIADAAAKEAERLGYNGYGGRILGAFRSQLRSESHEERFKRIRVDLCKEFAARFFPEDMVDDLVNAMRFRAKVAHSAFEATSPEEAKKFAKSIFSLEALCCLLTVKDLAIPDYGKDLLWGNSFISNRRFVLP